MPPPQNSNYGSTVCKNETVKGGMYRSFNAIQPQFRQINTFFCQLKDFLFLVKQFSDTLADHFQFFFFFKDCLTQIAC